MSKRTLASILPQRYGHQYPEIVRTVHVVAADHTAADSFGIWLQDQAKAAGRENLINPNEPWESRFKTVIRNTLNKSAQHRDDPALVEEVAHSVMMKINSDFLSKYDSSKGTNIQQYVLRRVQQRTIDYLQGDHGVNKRVNPTLKDDDGNTLDPLDQVSNDDVTDPEDRPEFQMEYNDLIRSINKYLDTTNRAEWYKRIFGDILEGNTRADIVKKYNVSTAIITRYIGGLEEELKKYAAKTDNELLAQLLSGGVGRRKKQSSDYTVMAAELSEVFQEYKSLTASARGRVARVTQHVITPVRVLTTKNLISDDSLSSFIQDQYLGDRQIASDTDDFIEKINAASDIIVSGDNDLTFLFK